MKKFINPLIASTILIISSGAVYAESYSEDSFKQILDTEDDDCNNKVTFKEFYQETVTDNKHSYDINRDGYITAGEVAIEMEQEVEATVNELRKYNLSEKNMNKTIAKELNAISKKSNLVIKKMDSDGDNLVEPEELKAYQHKQFNKLDSNDDGVITSSDLNKKKTHKGFGYRYKQ